MASTMHAHINRTAVARKMEIKLTFGKNDTVEQMRESLLEAPALDNLVLDECLCIDDNSVLQFIHVINRKLRTLEARKLYKFTDAAVEVIANRCKELQHVKFIGCNNLGQKSIISLGKHCKKLQSIAFIYENGTDWPLVDDVLSVLVGHFTSDLLATTFVGFKGITDIGISYVAECFHESLNAIDFSSCAHVTDGSLIGLATNCRLLRSVAFNSTSISDKGLKALSEKCINLQHVDVGNCVNVTDQSVKYLAEHCTLLEFISVENCKQITDASLRALTLHCGLLQNVNFHNTGVKKIPITILRLAFLVQFDVKMCKELSFPPPEIINKDVDGITDFYRKRHLGYRLRVLFLGNQGSGKSSLVQSLITDTAKLVDHPTDGVNVELWNPFHGVANEVLLERELSPDEKILGLDMWDTSGRTIFQHCHQLVMDQSILYVVVCNLTEDSSCESIVQHIDTIQTKAPNSNIIIVGTRVDKYQIGEKHDVKCKNILKAMKDQEDKHLNNIKSEIEKLSKLTGATKGNIVTKRIRQLQTLVKRRPKLPDTVIAVSCYTAQGLDDVRKEILTQALDLVKFPHLISSFQVPTTDVFNDIIQHRKDGKMLLSWQQFKDLALKPGRLEKEELLKAETKFLSQVGGIMKFEFPQLENENYLDSSIICLHPEALVQMLCSLHIDDDKKAFKFESSRFWPRGSSSSTPDPALLVKALEEIPTQGVIREFLLPLLWQKYNIGEDQVKEVTHLFQKLGFLVAKRGNVKGDNFDELQLPDYPSLSIQHQYQVPLLDLLPNNEPKLNWTPKPFKGDVQIGWRYECYPDVVSQSLITRLIAYSRTNRQHESYQHYWKHGVLLKICQVDVNIVRDQEVSNTVSVIGRVTVDEEGELHATQLLWSVLSRFIFVAESYLAEWQGLFSRVYLEPSCYYYQSADSSICLQIPLLECLNAVDSGKSELKVTNGTEQFVLNLAALIPFRGNSEKSVLEWVRWMACQNKDLNKDACSSEMTSHLPASPPIPRKNDRAFSPTKNSKWEKQANKKGDIKWDLDEDHITISKEDELREVNKVAASFVASVLASATAEYVAQQYDSTHKGNTSPSMAAKSVEMAAKSSADAAKATQSGNPEAAAKAVIAAAQAVDDAVNIDNSKPIKNGTSMNTNAKSSKMCSLL